MNNYQEINEKAWDNVNESMVDHTTAISHGEYLLAQSGELKVSLAGVKMVPLEWFPDLKGLHVLALASGGGQQGPVFAAHGANVTVTDLSDRQLAAERMVAEREGYNIRMHFMFDPDFKKEDVLISRHSLPFNPMKDLSEEQRQQKIKEHMPLAFSHTLTEQIGGLIQAGFEITDIYEDCDGGGLFDKYMNSYVAVRAVKK